LFTEENDATEKPTFLSFMKAFGVIAIGAITFLGAFAVFLILSDRPYAIQIFTLLCYTALVVLFVFHKTKLGRGYSLSNPAVQKHFPRLQAIHIAFSLTIFSFQTYILHVWSRFPASWTEGTGPRHNSWFNFGLSMLFAITWMIEVFYCRRILNRSCDSAKSTDSAIN